MTTTTTPRPLPPDAIAGLATIAEVCDVLRAWGHPQLADRLAYLASDADLDDGDQPATLESARGFLAFFGAVESVEGKLHLGTTEDGTICAHWRFPDSRSASLYFLDRKQVDYAARKHDGRFIDLDRNDAIVNLEQIAERLVDTKEWFTWFKERSAAVSSRRHTT